MTRSTLLLFCILVATAGLAQNSTADSLYIAAKQAAPEKRAELLLNAAQAYQENNPKRATVIAQEALDATKDPNVQARCELAIGLIYYMQGEYDSALEWYLKSLATREKLNDKKGQAQVLNEIGTLIKRQGDYEKSATYFRDALALAQQIGDSTQQANSMNNLGIAMEMLGKPDEAMTLYQQSADIKRKLKDFHGLSYNLDNMGMLLTIMKKYPEAEKNFEEAAAIKQQVGDRRGYAIVLNNIGEMWEARGNSDKALPYFSQALAIAEETKYADFRRHLYNVLSGIYERQKNYEKSLFYHRKQGQLKDSIYNEQKSKQLLEMETKYETEKKELLITEQQLTLEKNRAVMLGLVALIVLIIAIIFFWRYQLKLKEQRSAEQQQREYQETLTRAVINLQEKERSRFAKDLHDGFGQLITALKMQFEKIGQRSDGISELIQQMHDEIRNVSFALSPQVLVRDGLVEAVKELSFRINRANGAQVVIQATGFDQRLPADYEITLYRICQEWINNVMKYSNATRTDVQLIEHEDEVTLMIEDNGKGFDLQTLEQSTGNGWKNIQSRIQILRGSVEIDSDPGRTGTTFTANIPLK